MTIGNCPHGEFVLEDGCPQCIAEYRAILAEQHQAISAAKKEMDPSPMIVKVRYYSETTNELSGREYTYFTAEPLAVGDVVMVPVRDTTTKAKVSAIDVSEAEIASFKDKVKTIPAGSRVVRTADPAMIEELEEFPVPRSEQTPLPFTGPDPNAWRIGEEERRTEEHLPEGIPKGGLAEAAALAGAEVTVTKFINTKINLCDTCSLRNDYPICCSPDIEFGDGEGNDNIIQCSKYNNGPAEPCSIPLNVEIRPQKMDLGPGDAGATTVTQELMGELESLEIEPLGEQQLPSTEEEDLIMAADRLPVVVTPVQVMAMDDAVQLLADEAHRFLEYARGRVVNDSVSEKKASEDLNLIRGAKKAIEAKRKEYLDPINAQAAEIRDFFKLLSDPIEEADKLTTGVMLAYDAKVTRQREEAERIEQAALKLAREQEELSGEHTVSLAEIPKPEEAKKQVRTGLGLTSKVDHWKWKAVNINAIPREYLIPDEAMLNSIAKKHHNKKTIPGIEFYNEPHLASRSS